MPRATARQRVEQARQRAEQFSQQAQSLRPQGFGDMFAFGFDPNRQFDASMAEREAIAAQDFATSLEQQALQREAAAPGLYQAGVAGGLDMRQIPGAIQALEQGGPEVLNQLLQNPAAPRSQAYQMANRRADFTGNDIQSMIDRQQQRFRQDISAPTEVADAYLQIDNALQQGDSLGAQAALIKLAKILDPTSVVREGEVDVIRGGMGLGQSLQAVFNQAFGQGFSPEGAQALRATARSVALPTLERGQRIFSDYGTALDSVLGSEFAGRDRIRLGTGYDFDAVQAIIDGSPVIQIRDDNGQATNITPVDLRTQ